MKGLDIEKVEVFALRKGWSFAALQKKAGLGSMTLPHIRDGKHKASASTIYKLAKAFECDPVELLKEA